MKPPVEGLARTSAVPHQASDDAPSLPDPSPYDSRPRLSLVVNDAAPDPLASGALSEPLDAKARASMIALLAKLEEMEQLG